MRGVVGVGSVKLEGEGNMGQRAGTGRNRNKRVSVLRAVFYSEKVSGRDGF